VSHPNKAARKKEAQDLERLYLVFPRCAPTHIKDCMALFQRDSTVKLFAMMILQMKISKWTSLLLIASSCSFCIGSSSVVLGFGRHANSYRLLLAESNRV
jgi:hypothetical protein